MLVLEEGETDEAAVLVLLLAPSVDVERRDEEEEDDDEVEEVEGPSSVLERCRDAGFTLLFVVVVLLEFGDGLGGMRIRNSSGVYEEEDDEQVHCGCVSSSNSSGSARGSR